MGKGIACVKALGVGKNLARWRTRKTLVWFECSEQGGENGGIGRRERLRQDCVKDAVFSLSIIGSL